MHLLDKSKSHDGKYIEIYRAVHKKGGGNYVRAVGHGVLDVMTCGLWEVVGTPVEGALSEQGHITVRAQYAREGDDKPEKIEIS